MKIWVISDLHLEFGEPFEVEPPPGTDVLVCAGDVLTKGIVPSLEWLGRSLKRNITVVFVAGNHEFYHGSITESVRAAKLTKTFPNIHFLENGKMEIDGVSFLGGTLWTDFRLFDRKPEIAMSYARSGMYDFKHIKFSKQPYRRFVPNDALRMHQQTRAYFTSELKKRSGKPTVVVSHHAPSPRSVSPDFRHDPLSACYVSDLEDLIIELEPAIWVHGHVHHRCDYKVGATRVIANARGYPGEHSGFDPALTVEVFERGM